MPPKACNLTLTFLLLLPLLRCHQVPQIEGFDSSGWVQDKNGCQGLRLNLEETLWTNRVKLMDIPESQIIELLGKPNYTELYVRNQKFFVYYIGASAECAGSNPPRSLWIRFDALNYSSEISIRD